ncbi:ribonuclease P protein subunit p29-like [Ornithodoros turicata]
MDEIQASTTGKQENILKSAQAMKYKPPLPQQQSDFINTFVSKTVRASDAEKWKRSSTTLYALFERNIIRSKKSRKKKGKLLTCKEKRSLGIFNVKAEKLAFKSFLPIHNMWKDYFRDAVGQNMWEPGSPALLKAEYCGCLMVVAAAKCPSYVGKRGIVIQETKNVFRIITAEDRIVTIPKAHTLFAFEHDGRLFKIYGSHFRVHSFERIKSKFKVKGSVTISGK